MNDLYKKNRLREVNVVIPHIYIYIWMDYIFCVGCKLLYSPKVVKVCSLWLKMVQCQFTTRVRPIQVVKDKLYIRTS